MRKIYLVVFVGNLHRSQTNNVHLIMSSTSSGKRKKTDDERLSSIMSDINAMTREETSKIRKTYNKSGKCRDIEILRDETGERILHNRRLLSQSSWARSTFANLSYSCSNFDSDQQIRLILFVK